ncbi:MAG: YidC/Oxa1 family insertase periplasmic-domain containing protein, partial [Planctomycetaceae bacterium]
YELQGPVGLPLEDQENSRTYIEVKAGTLEDKSAPLSVSTVSQTAAQVVKQVQKAAGNAAAVETWKSPLKYVGVDVQYFAALIMPQGNQLESRYFSEARPVLVDKDPKNEAWSDVSIQLVSETVPLEPGQSLNHKFRAFFGPKRSELLDPLSAGGVQNFGWFAIISRGMLAVLNFFHNTLLAPYGIAIIMLTVVVRACMFPISRKMAQNQQRMKELQPKMQEIRTKYKDDQERMAKEYREFMAKNGFNPLAGCLPMFLQLPIFFGLYQALYNSVDLRMARFLWIDNLAAPDQMFAFGFTLPFVGWTHFNLLPLITVVLFVVQQKMFMPPPTSEEQAMQYKMMNFFTIFIGFMFYRVPAGLCVYFIASSLWGIAERKLLELMDTGSSGASSASAVSSDGGRSDDGFNSRPSDPAPPKPPGLLQRLMEAADHAKDSTNGSRLKREPRDSGKDSRRGGHGRKTKPRP